MSYCRWGEFPGSPYVYGDCSQGIICVDCALNDFKTLKLKSHHAALLHIAKHKKEGPRIFRAWKKAWAEEGKKNPGWRKKLRKHPFCPI